MNFKHSDVKKKKVECVGKLVVSFQIHLCRNKHIRSEKSHMYVQPKTSFAEKIQLCTPSGPNDLKSKVCKEDKGRECI